MKLKSCGVGVRPPGWPDEAESCFIYGGPASASIGSALLPLAHLLIGTATGYLTESILP
jgi:hypothetical protein